jgi:hypothetical protein
MLLATVFISWCLLDTAIWQWRCHKNCGTTEDNASGWGNLLDNVLTEIELELFVVG